MADSKYNIVLGIGADTSKAKSEIQGLQKELNKLTSFKGGLNGFDVDEKLYKATAAVKEFQIKLQSAVNTDTGKLDLSILSKSLKDSGKSLQDYAKSFKDLGPQGQQAFNSVTQAIMNAEVPLRRTNKLIQEMGVSLKNTIKWQISSSAVHAFMGAVQGAYGYVEDLNKSLNNIRIVTGRSADEMADFAKQANKAAKELSVSTTTYTDAALIYYQQGLDDEQVKQRTNTTVKMANVTGESATNVSSYMTAIWNNFDDGSKSLEYFGDVITALGAATAASSEEIAGGLEKFAAVGETVGLSYEYATAALTTIIDKTRQSEDVVGTALKTIFARIQGLQQGDTAEDGVTLNKYSTALANVGIQIMDTSGELKAMDEILNELGQRWQTLSKAEQVALAQTVGGTRQYTQLIALMDNWGAMQENLSTAYNSSGALEEQAEIYAESWEAAQQRVTTALQTIYQELLNDKFFIRVTNLVADSIELVSKLIDTVGGLPGVLAVAGVAFTTLFKNEIPQLMRGAEGFIKDLTGASKEEGYSLKEQAIYENKKMLLEDVNDKGLTEEKVNNRYASRQILITEMEKSKKYSEEEIAYYKTKIELEKQWGEEIVKRAAAYDKAIEDVQKEQRVGSEILDKLAGGKASKAHKKKFEADAKAKKNGEKLSSEYTEEELKLLDDYNISLEKTNKLKDIAKEKNKETEKGLKTLDNIYAENNQNMDIYNEESKKALTTVEQGFVSAGKAVASFAISVSTVTGIIGILNDDSMSFFEKIETILPMLLVAIPSIVSTIKNVTAATALFNAEGQKGILIKTAELLLGANYEKQLGKEFTLKTLLEKVQEKLNNEEGKGILVKTADWIITKMLGGATTTAAGATLTLAGAIGSLLLALAPYLVAVLAIGAAWAFLKYNSPEEKLKRANKDLEEAKKAAQDASNAYNDLKSSIDSLKSAQDTLAGLTEGTQEWKEAVLQVNQQVLDLIEKYPELANYMTSENGVLGISEEGLNAQMDAQYAQAQSMQLLALSKNREVIDLENQIQKDNFDNISHTGTKVETVSVTNTGAGPYTGTTEYTTQESKVTTKISAEDAAKIGKNILDNDAIKEDGTVDFEKIGLGDATKEFKDAINANIGEILQLAETFKQLDNEVLSLDESIASTWLRSHKTGANSEDINFMASGMAKVLDKNRDEVEQDFKGAKDQDYIEAFAKINHTTVEAVQQSIEDGVYSIDQIKDSVIDNAALTKSQAEINEKVQEFKGATGDKEVDQVISNLVASGGDLSVISTLETGIREKVVAAIQNNPELQAAFEKHSDYFGKDFANKIVNHLQDPEYEANMQRILDQQFNEKLESTATGLGVDKDALESYVNYLQEADDDLKGNRDAALAAAEANIKFSQGAEKVTKAFDDYKEVLEEADESTWEYHEAIAAVQEAATEMLGIEVDTNYVKEHLEDIQKAAEGDEEALTRLQQTAAKNWADNFVQGVQSVKEVVDETGKVITEGFDANTWASQFTSAVDTVAQHLGALDTNITMEADAEPALEELVNLANEAMRAGQMTQEQMQAMFGSMGYSPEVELIDVPTKPQTTTTTGTFEGPFGIKFTYGGTSTSTSTIQVPQIKDANGDGSTSFTKISGSNKLKSSAGKKASKGSSGGGNKKEAERYHEIKNVIEDITKELDSIGSAKDRAFGKDKLALMDQEIAKLEDMKAAQEQYLTEIEKFYDQDKKAIAKFGAEFDEEGRIINYDELMSKYGSNEEAIKALEQYEETYDLLKDKQQEIADIQNQIYDAALEKIDYKVDLQIEINSDDLEYLEFLLENLTDAAYDAADAIANLGQQTAEQLQNQEIYTQGINDIFAEHGLGDNVVDQFLNGSLTAKDLADMEFTEAEVETLRKYRDGLIETTRALINLREETWNKVMEAITALSDEFDKQADRVDHAIGVMDSYRNIIDIVGKDALGIFDDMMKMFDETAVDTAMDALTVSKAKYDTLLEQYNITKKEYNAAIAAGNTEEAEKLAEVLDGIKEEMQDAQNDMLSDWENALEKANQLFEENTKRILENFKDAMAGQFESLETLQDDFAKTRELDDMYVDDYKKIYELSKLTRDINRSIDETDNLAAKTALRDMQKEINDLQEAGVELSEYDLDYLRAKYELRLAEIALEDAQNAKSQVRMTRDSEGNWSYTYTADQDNIDNAQQNYEDKLYAIQELSTNYIKDLEEQIIDLSANLAEEIAAIDRTVYASEEAYNAEVERITNFYQQKMDILGQQMNNALNNNNEIYTQDWTNYSNATGYKISADELFLTKFGETTSGIKLGFDTMQGYQEAFNAAIGSPDTPGTLLGDLSQNYKDWQTKVDDVMKTAGTSMDTFKETASDVLEDTKKKTDEVANSMDNEKDPKGLKQKAKAAFDAALKAAQDFEKAYGPEIDKVITKNTNLVTSLNNIIGKWGEIKTAADNATTAAKNYNQYASNPSTVGGGGKGGGHSGGGTIDTDKNKTPTTTGSNNSNSYGGWILTGARNSNGYYMVQNLNTNHYASAIKTGGKNSEGKTQYQIVSGDEKNKYLYFDTGGYTGEWGSSGRLAMLHEKELVLNADDTKNMFSIIDAVRDIVKSIDLNANTGGFGLGNLISAMIPSSESNLNQNVEIKAEFPNVTDRGEIEAAFDNLINKASQYANRK